MFMNILYVTLAYCIGSVSSAILVCRLWQLPDPRTEGSNNPGATNVLRIGGKVPAIITLLGDALKGVIPVLLAVHFELPAVLISAIMLAAFLGHLFPAFFGFQGGKGVATAIGAILALSWQVGLCVIATWLAVVAITRISSLGAICASIAAPLIAYGFLSNPFYTATIGIMTVLLLYRHKGNIERLIRGQESKVGKK